MAIGFTNGSITTTSSEQTIFNVTADQHFSAWIFAHNMTSSETVVIRIKVIDTQTSTMREYDSVTLTGVQTSPAYYIPWLPTKQYQVTIQRTAGTDRAFSWTRAEVV